jgi:UPF0716 family protein affecting phage T7 exclusion
MEKLKLIFKGIRGYIHIILFPVLISMIVSVVLYLNLPDEAGIVVALFLCLCGFVTGLIMALRVLKQRGADAFVSEPDYANGDTNELNKENL